jgi:hypothetical protein
MAYSKTYIKDNTSSVADFFNQVSASVERDLMSQPLWVVDCPPNFLEKALKTFKCPIQLSMLEDGLTLHTV